MKKLLLHRALALFSALLVVVLTLAGLVRPAQAAPLQWQWRNPLPQGHDLSGITYGGGKFVAVGDIGTVVTSTDGTTWTVQTNVTTAYLRGVAYGDNQWVAVGAQGTVITSTDGTTWHLQPSIAGGPLLYSVAYASVGGQNLWVASVAATGTVYTSADGQTWTPHAVPGASGLRGITYAGGQFVLVGSGLGPKVYTSSDGTNWAPQSMDSSVDSSISLYGVAYSDSLHLWAASGARTSILTSTAAATWQQKLHDASNPRQLWGLAWGAGRFIGVGEAGTLVTSNADGSTWSLGTSGVSTNLYGITYGAGTFVAVGQGGTIITLADGTTWSNQTTAVAAGNIDVVVYDGTRFVAEGASSGGEIVSGYNLYTSTDGSTWTPSPQQLPFQLARLIYAAGKYVGVTNGGSVVISSDAQTLKDKVPVPTGLFAIAGVAYNGTTYVAASQWDGRVVTSTDGGARFDPTFLADNYFNAIIYAGGQFVAVGASGTIAVSRDGKNWTTPASGTGNELYGVTYDGQKYVAVGGSGTVVTSSDGATWTALTANITDNLTSVAYGGGLFVSVLGWSSTIATSTDLSTWTPQLTPAPAVTNGGLAYGAGVWVLVGRNGTILSTLPPAAPTPPPLPVFITTPAAGTYTNNSQYTFKGNAISGATVTVAIDGTAAGTAKLDASGTQWSFTPTAPLADGPHTVTATANGYTTSAIPFTVKTKPPILTVGAMPGGGITNQNKPTLTGTTESGATVSLALYTNTSAVATVTPDNEGNWSYTFPVALADNSYSLTFTATDLAGNTTTVTKPLKIKTSIPAVAITPPAGPASVNQPVVTGTAEAGSTVALYLGGGWAATATADGSCAWSATLPALLDGSYWITASATDAADNVGWAKGVALRVATAAQPVTITAPANGSATNQAQPVIAGTAKAGSTVNVTLDGKPAATGTAGNAGQWQYSPAAPLPDGSHTVSALATDPAGTASTTGPVTFTVKTSVPAITLNLPSGNLTTPLTASGTAEVSSTVKVYVDGNLAASVQPDASGAWSASVATADGSHTVTATATDAAGNVGKAPALTVQVVPAVTSSTPDGAHFTTAEPTFSGTAQPGSTVAVILDGTPWGSVTASASGRWSYTPAILADASHTVSATATDAQGLSGTAPARTFTVNTTPVTLTDIAGNPAADAVTSLVQQGVFTGFPDGTFRPDLGVTRAQLAVVYARALGLQPQPGALLPFTDRSQIGAWAEPYVAAMVQQGILHGYPDGSFRPNATISRAELASLLARLLQQRGITVQATAPVISDQFPAWAADSIRTAAAAGLVTPTANGTFNPAAPATRGQTAQAFYRLLSLLQGH